MDPYNSEEEQIRAIREWWRHNGSSTLTGIGLALAIVFGWQWWQQRAEARSDEASALYRQLLESAERGAGDAVQQTTALHLAQQLKDMQPSGRFGHYASLLRARVLVEKDDLAAAETELRALVEQLPVEAPGFLEAWVREQFSRQVDPQIGVLARLRLGQVLVAQGKPDDALVLLEQGDPEIFLAEREEMRGDILLAKGDRKGALDAYSRAAERAKRDGVTTRLLDIKKEELRIAAGEPS